eukprot:SRR837773.15241.p1 GENE.SRR837773.15241~~SRR837773.15241.p1  ORF type:complete len:134 (+),score=12.88 SRR837773.15241:58-402(+)
MDVLVVTNAHVDLEAGHSGPVRYCMSGFKSLGVKVRGQSCETVRSNGFLLKGSDFGSEREDLALLQCQVPVDLVLSTCNGIQIGPRVDGYVVSVGYDPIGGGGRFEQEPLRRSI